MAHAQRRSPTVRVELPKCATGIRGLDQITGGGLPRGRPTLVCGNAGTGKTLLGIEFLVRGAREHGEPGVFVSFEERPRDLVENTGSLGFGLDQLVAQKKIFIDQIAIDRSEILETGEYNLDGLFIRLGAAIDAVGAKRVVLDTIEALFAALTNVGVLRSELRRLFGWLKDKGVTTIVTGERGEGTFTRQGLEEYVSDCVILLDQRVTDQVATRRLRIVKYRGSLHGTNEYPFLIDEHGFVALPITGITLDYAAPRTFVPTGVAMLDTMLAGKGYYRGSTIMVSGAAGTGKSSMAAHFVDAACRRGERCLYFAFEESADQAQRNMRSIGLDMGKWARQGLLHFHAARPATFGLETHISMMLNAVEQLRPRIVVLDPVSSFESAGTVLDARAMLMRLIDLLKARQVTTLFTSLTAGGESAEQSGVGISSLVDTWILLRNLEHAGERTRALHVLKSRGMKHSGQVREMVITDQGLRLEDIAMGPDGVLIGSARVTQRLRDRLSAMESRQEIIHKRDELARRHKVLKARIAELEAEFHTEANAIEQGIAQEKARQAALLAGRAAIASGRQQVRAARRGGGNGEAQR